MRQASIELETFNFPQARNQLPHRLPMIRYPTPTLAPWPRKSIDFISVKFP